MAIPFNIPPQQQTEDVLDELLELLHALVQQIVLYRRQRQRAGIPAGIPAPQPRNREQQRRDNGGGDNEGRNAEPPVNANQQQGMDSEATGRIPRLPVVIPVANTRPAPPPPEVPIPPPRRDTPAGGVRPRSRPQPRHPKRRPGSRNNRKTTSDVPSDSRTSENWQLVGRDLRKIADNFRTSRLEVGRGPDNSTSP